MVRRLSWIELCLLALPLHLAAHTVPSLTIEAEFDAARNAVIQVNLDPRLFLSPQPTSLPPVPASWWLDQDASSRRTSESQAAGYLDRVLRFTVGEAAVKGAWKVTPIDSASAFPLTANSAEVHLLLEHRGALPAVDGDFKVVIGNDCGVGVILVTSVAGKPERHPQALFPGESSRGVKLPVPASAAAAPVEAAGTAGGDSQPVWGMRSGHAIIDHVLVAVVLGILAGGRVAGMLLVLLGFHAAHSAAASAVLGGWLPHAPVWMMFAQWIAVGAGVVAAAGGRASTARAAGCFAAAGVCHGLDVPHLHLPDAGSSFMTLVRDDAMLFALQGLAMAVAAGVIRIRGARGVEPGTA